MDQQLRIGDAERERAAADLAEHYAQGRLTADEHAERLDRIWAARTRADLGPVFSDLPGATVAAGPERPRRSRPPRFPLLAVLAVVVLLAVVAHAPWLLVLPVVAFVLVRRALWSRCVR
jgi:Domain of unknown function (DUF1707)